MNQQVLNQISTLPIQKKTRGRYHRVNCPVCFSTNLTKGSQFIDKKRKYHENPMQVFAFRCNYCPTSEIFYTCADSKNNLWYLNQDNEVIRGIDPNFDYSHICKCGGRVKKDIRESDGLSSVPKYKVAATEPARNWRIFLSCSNCVFETEVFNKELLPSFEFATSKRQKMIPRYIEEKNEQSVF